MNDRFCGRSGSDGGRSRPQIPRKRWGDLTTGQRAAILAAAAVEVVLTTTALVDLARRPSAQVRGSKPLWALGCLVQPIGPIAYLVLGRRPSRADR